MTDGEEIQFNFDLFQSADAFEDADGDGFPNLIEIQRGALPKNASSIPARDIIVSAPTTAQPHPVQAAIDALANQGIDYGVIQLRPGDYLENLHVTARPIILIGDGSYPGPSLDGQVADSVIEASRDCVLIGLRLKNGDAALGGGIHVTNARIRLTNCILMGNTADQGGAVALENAQAWLQNCTLVENVALVETRGIYLSGSTSELWLDSSIVWNGPVEDAADFGPQLFTPDGNPIHATRNDILGSYVGQDNFDSEPILNVFGHLVVYSPCINAFATSLLSPMFDADHESRGDGFPDLGADEYVDADGDFLPDKWASYYPVGYLGAWNADPDGDGLINFDEYQFGTDAKNSDMDDDGLPDGYEISMSAISETGQAKFNPFDLDADNDGIDDGDEDYDGDGLSNSFEASHGYDATKMDSDGNGINDGQEDFDQDGIPNAEEELSKRYAVVEMGPAYSWPKRLTNSGIVLVQGNGHFYRWKAGVSTELTLSGSREFTCEDMNNDGTVVGASFSTDDDFGLPIKGTIWQQNSSNAQENDSPNSLIQWRSTSRDAIDDAGNIAEHVTDLIDDGYFGYYPQFSTSYINGARIVSGNVPVGHFADLGPWAGTLFYVFRLNNNGMWIGRGQPWDFIHNGGPGPGVHGTPYYAVSDVELGFFPVDLNDDGFVVGFDGVNRGYYFDATTGGTWTAHTLFPSITPYGTSYRIQAVNNRHQAISTLSSQEADYQILASNGLESVLWEKPRNYDGVPSAVTYQPLRLSSLLHDGTSWSSVKGTDINDNSVICASARKNTDNLIYSILLLPMELTSKDRVLRGSVEIPEGWADFGLSFKNKTKNQDLGTFEKLEPGASGSTVKIYDSPDDFFSDEEMEQNQSGSLPDNAKNQKVTFARDPENPRKLQFCAVFDDVGEVEIKLKFGPNQTEGFAGHTLTTDAPMAAFINQMTERVASIEVPDSDELLIDIDGDGIPDGAGANDLIQARQPGSMVIPGALLNEELEADPLNLVLRINDDDDDVSGYSDNSNTIIGSNDNDVSRLLLKRPGNLASNTGTLTLSVSNSSAVRIFNSNGSAVLSSTTVDLANPTGDLAGLANGSVPIYVEGLVEAADVIFTLTYRNSQNEVVSSDSVHLTVTDPSQFALLQMQHGMQVVKGDGTKIKMRSYAENGALQLDILDLVAIGQNPSLQNRGQLAKIFWNATKNNLQVAWVKGFVDGFWVALKGEKDSVVGVWTFFTNDPFGRSAAMYGAVKEAIGELKEVPINEIPGLLETIAVNITSDLYTAAENQLPWEPLTTSLSPDVLFYMHGFASGTVTEGVAVSLIGVGIATKTSTAIRGIIASCKTGRYALTMLNDLRKATAKTTHILLQLAKSESGSVNIGAIGKFLEKTEMPSGKKAAEVFEEALHDKPELTNKVVENYDYHYHQAAIDEAATRLQQCAHSLAKLKDTMGNSLTDEGLESFTKLQQRMFVKGSDSADCLPELMEMFDTSSAAGKAKFNQFLEDSKSILDDPRSALPDGGGIDAPDRGFILSTKEWKTVEENLILERYGSPNGEYLALEGTPKWAVSLPPANQGTLRRYLVKIPFNADVGRTSPWFGQPGGAIQIDLHGANKTVAQLVADLVLEEITP